MNKDLAKGSIGGRNSMPTSNPAKNALKTIDQVGSNTIYDKVDAKNLAMKIIMKKKESLLSDPEFRKLSKEQQE